VAISAAITAYGRILIYQYKRIPGNDCYYTVTDYVFLAEPLDSKFRGNDIGQMKLEAKIKKAVFVYYKLDANIDDNNNTIFRLRLY
jgi:hypothetical protein